MNFLRTSYCRKTVAVTFLLLFVFIYAVKALHTHDLTSISSFAKSTAVKADFYCAICDFQLAKDCDTEIPVLIFSAPVQFVQVYYNYTISFNEVLPVTSAVRGPPVIA
jgi:hypothetical protein